MPQPKMTAEEFLAAYAAGQVDFHALDLSGTNLAHASLRSAYLADANLTKADLSGADLTQVRLDGADLQFAVLNSSILFGADLRGANLSSADLSQASLRGADLRGARLNDANLLGADVRGAKLGGASFRGTTLGWTMFAELDVSELCEEGNLQHAVTSHIDWSTVAQSCHHPGLKQFMVACGVPSVFAEYMIDCARAVGDDGLRTMLQSTFISYGRPDEDFARKLNEALRASQIGTFFFPEHAKVGERISQEIYRRLKECDRVLLVCSRSSLTRAGVLHEIQETLDREAAQGGATILLPIKLDDFAEEEWHKGHSEIAERVCRRVIADFRGAETDDAKFGSGLARVIDALKAKPVSKVPVPYSASLGRGMP